MSAGFLRMLSQSPMSMSSGGSTPPIFHELTKILTDEINKQKKKQSTTSASADRVVPFIFHLSVSLRKKKRRRREQVWISLVLDSFLMGSVLEGSWWWRTVSIVVETARTIRWQVCDEVAASHTLLPHELVHHWWLWPHIDVQMLKDRPQHTTHAYTFI